MLAWLNDHSLSLFVASTHTLCVRLVSQLKYENIMFESPAENAKIKVIDFGKF